MNRFLKFLESLQTDSNALLIESIRKGYTVLHEVSEPLKPRGARKFKRRLNEGGNTESEVFGKRFKTSTGNVVEVIFIPESDNWYEVVFTVNNSYDDDATLGKARDPEIFSGVLYLMRQMADENGIDKIQIRPREGKGDKRIVKGLSTEDVHQAVVDELSKYEKSLEGASYPESPSASIAKILEKRGREWNAHDWYMGPIYRDISVIHKMLSKPPVPSDGEVIRSWGYTMRPIIL